MSICPTRVKYYPFTRHAGSSPLFDFIYTYILYGMASSGRFLDEEVMKEELNINNQNESFQTKKMMKGFDTMY
ncbi:hypothetical protein CON38_02350 [Bacillus cereus]|nr:hypothetical protein CON38_02350 [Bacillus cereus]